MMPSRSLAALALCFAFVGCGNSGSPDAASAQDAAAPLDLEAIDAAAVADSAAVADLSATGDLATMADAASLHDLLTTDAAPDGGLPQVGDNCGQSANGRECAPGLACCYPCGIQGCNFQCTVACAPGSPGCSNGCLLRQ